MIVKSLSHVRLLVTPWAAAYQAPLSMGFPSQEYWSELPLPPPRDLPDPGIKPTSPALAGKFFTTGPPGKPPSRGLMRGNKYGTNKDAGLHAGLGSR